MKTINEIFDNLASGKTNVTSPEELSGVSLKTLPAGVTLRVKRAADVLEIEHIEPRLRARVLIEHSIEGDPTSEAVTNINDLALGWSRELHRAYTLTPDEYRITPEPIAAFHVDDNSDIEVLVQQADAAIAVILVTARELLTKAARGLTLRAPEIKEDQEQQSQEVNQ